MRCRERAHAENGRRHPGRDCPRDDEGVRSEPDAATTEGVGRIRDHADCRGQRVSLRRNARDMNHSQIVSFIWGVADLIRDTFKRGKYQDVILPLTVLRRLDCVLAPTRRKVLAAQARFKGRLDNLGPAAPSAPPDSPSTTRRATTSRSCSPTPPTSRRTCATTSPGSAPTCARCSRSSTSTTPSRSSTRRACSSRSCSGSATPRSTCTPTRSTTPPWAPSSRSSSASSTRR